jgi:hypothetical protein
MDRIGHLGGGGCGWVGCRWDVTTTDDQSAQLVSLSRPLDRLTSRRLICLCRHHWLSLSSSPISDGELCNKLTGVMSANYLFGKLYRLRFSRHRAGISNSLAQSQKQQHPVSPPPSHRKPMVAVSPTNNALTVPLN